MPLITETYYLSLTQDNRGILRLRCSQDDTLRTVNLKLYNNGSIFTIPSGISAYVSGVKQNGAVFSKSCTISQDRKSVILQLSSNITNVDGVIIAEIVLNDGNGDRLGSSNFIIQVEKNPIRVGVIQDTETPIEYVNDFITQIQALTARVNNLITPNGDPSLAEVVDARISSLDNNTYQNLKARIDADIATLNTRKANKSEVYTKAQVDTLLDNVEIDVDGELSDKSENPVQNKVVAGAISTLQDNLAILADITPIPDNSDLNSYGETGLYSIEYGNYTILNYPPVPIVASYLEVRKMTTGYVGQKLTIPGTGKVFTRRRFNNGQWNNWIQITGLEWGLSTDEKRAIVDCFENLAWASNNGKTVLDTLKTLWSDVLPKYADLKYPNGDIVVKTNYHLIKGSNSVLSSEVSNFFKVIGIGEKCDDTSPIAFDGLYGISIKGYNSITPTYSMVNPSNNTDIILMVTRIENGVFYVVSMGEHLYSGDSINISNFVNKDYYAFFNMRDVNIITDVASLSIALQ